MGSGEVGVVVRVKVVGRIRIGPQPGNEPGFDGWQNPARLGPMRLALRHTAILGYHPRPTSGMFVAITVMNNTFAASGIFAMQTTARATFSTSIVASTAIVPFA